MAKQEVSDGNKLCCSCKIKKSYKEYHLNRTRKDGVNSYCKACISVYKVKYIAKNKERLKEYSREYRLENSEKRKEYNREYRLENAEKVRVYGIKRRQENPGSWAKWRAKNVEKARKSKREYEYRKRHTDINYKLISVLRSRIYMALKKSQKAGSAVRDLGCTIEELRTHLEDLFQEGMSWDNHGDWHIDHIEPLTSFDLTDREQFLKACHYTNLQPLWAKDNLLKGSKLKKNYFSGKEV